MCGSLYTIVLKEAREGGGFEASLSSSYKKLLIPCSRMQGVVCDSKMGGLFELSGILS